MRNDCRGFEAGWIGVTFYPNKKIPDHTGMWNYLNSLMFKDSKLSSNFRVLIRGDDFETPYPEYCLKKNSEYSFDMISTCNISMLTNIKHIYEEEKNANVISFFSDIFGDKKDNIKLAIITAIHGTTFSVPLDRIYQTPQSKRKLMF